MPSHPKHPKRNRRKGATARRRKASRLSARTARGSAAKVGPLFEDLVALQARLLAPDGCPWDREQTHRSLRPFLVEEAYEVLDAMESGSAEKFAGELGDLLLQIVFHAELAQAEGRFDIGDVIRAVHTKMVRRHPHVFGKVKARTSAEVLKNWEQIKAEERASEGSASAGAKKGESVLSGVPRSLPALLEAYQLTRRASNVGFDWENVSGVFDKLNEEISEFQNALAERGGGTEDAGRQIEEEMGDLLFAAVNVARFSGVDPEIALKSANRKFLRRFAWMEQRAEAQGRRFADAPRGEMEELWNESKLRG